MNRSRRPDPRTAATRAKIVNAYVKLLAVMPSENISIINICSTANINRTTFYRHFYSINDIEEEIEDKVLKTFLDLLNSVSLDDFLTGRKDFLKKVSETIIQDLDFYSEVLMINNHIRFIDKINEVIKDKLKETMIHNTSVSYSQIDYYLTFAVAGRIAVYRKWIKEGFKQSENTISEILEIISSSGFDFLLN